MFSGLNRKVLYPLILLFSIIFGISLFFSQFKARAVLQNELTERLEQEVAMTAKMIDNWLADRTIDIKTWSLQEVFVEALTETGYYGRSAGKGAQDMLALLEKGYPYYSILFLADTSGNMLVSSKSTDQQEINVSNRRYFQEAMKGESAISDIILGMVTGSSVITINSPVIVNNNVVGVLTGVIPTIRISSLFVDDFNLKEKSYAYLLNHRGKIVANSNEPQHKKNSTITDDFFRNFSLRSSGKFIYEKNNDSFLNVFKRLNQKGWYFGISQSLDVTLLPLSQLAGGIIMATVISLILSSIILIVMFRVVVLNRLRVILDGMREVTKGNYKDLIPTSHNSKDEITDLSNSFNSMIKQLDTLVGSLNVENAARKAVEKKLAAHQENLEETVRIRTKELEQEINQRKEAELKLARAEKMEMMGALAGGVAHDLNNILTGIVSYPDFLLTQIDKNDFFYNPLQTIKKSGVNAAAIVQDLLTLARRGLVSKEYVNWNKLINDYLESPEFLKLQQDHPGISLKVTLDENLLPISGSPVHLNKTLMNLIINGFESMSDKGTLSITSENIYIDNAIATSQEMKEGGYTLIKICDQGEGISAEDKNKIFEPFYTTKKMGKSGTGLGMAVVEATVKDHGGFIDCESVVSEGTTFFLFFPVDRALTQEKQTISDQDHLLRGTGEQILVVDDVQEQREIASYILDDLGYQVSTAESGEEAVMLCRHFNYDLLLLDMMLGAGMDGLETYEQVVKFKPDQRAVIASGFSESARVKKAMALGAGSYIKKPYIIKTISKAIRNEIDR
ncbi:cache domain-containing protein [Desulfogranum marinum]|uniref:cache domain-containing protein n=1 Tax=Desulfogranum marinum TaxID=453220 RepID=UPI0029C6CC67|nr:cache domain-containing protein [Desulfogranum marinum]